MNILITGHGPITDPGNSTHAFITDVMAPVGPGLLTQLPHELIAAHKSESLLEPKKIPGRFCRPRFGGSGRFRALRVLGAKAK